MAHPQTHHTPQPLPQPAAAAMAAHHQPHPHQRRDGRRATLTTTCAALPAAMCNAAAQPHCSAAATLATSSSSSSSCVWAFRCSASDDAAGDAARRRLSSLGCSTSSSSSQPATHSRSSSSHRWRPPFASMSAGPQLSAAAGQQRQGASSSGGGSSGTGQQQANDGLPQQLLERDLQQLAQDVFKAGDSLAGGRYTLVRKIPQQWGLADGRFTTVWQGRDAATNRDVVIKCVEAGDAGSFASGTREAALHAAAGRHANIVSLLDAFEHRSKGGRHAVLVTEAAGTNLQLVSEQYVGAVDLDQQAPVLYQGICSSPRSLRHIARHTLAALDHLHSRGLAHMDLSADNLVIDRTFKPAFQIHQGTLFPPGNWLKGLHSWWRLLVSRGSADSQLAQEMEQALRAAPFCHEGNLHKAVIKLTDFGRAVPFAQLQQQADDEAAAGGGGSGAAAAATGSTPLQYNRDGVVVFGDPRCRPPEEVLGMAYAGPAYDAWKLGCLLYQLATTEALFDTSELQAARDSGARPQLEGYGDNELLLHTMTELLGPLPRQFVRQSPLFRDYFIDKTAHTPSKQQRGRRHKGNSAGAAAAAVESDPLRISNVLLSQPGNSLERHLRAHTALSDADARGLAAFMTPLLTYDPAERPSAAQMLQHAWLQSDPSSGEGDDVSAGGREASQGAKA